MTSWPLMTGTTARDWMAEGRSKLEERSAKEAGRQDQSLLDLTAHIATIAIGAACAAASCDHSPVGVDTAEELRSQLHVVEVVNDRLPVGLDLAIGDVEVVVSSTGSGSASGGRRLFGPARVEIA